MKLLRPNCRDQFTHEDFAFITDALGSETDRDVLLDLLTDPEMRDMILDQDKLRDVILENPKFLHITPHLYFYVLVRQTFRRGGIDDRELTDYVAELLTDFTNSDGQRRSLPDNVKDSSYLFEMMAALQEADDQTAFQIRAHIGNRSLFMISIWPTFRFNRRSSRK